MNLSIEKDKKTAIVLSTVLLFTSYKLIRALTNKSKSQSTKEIPVPGSSYWYVGHMFSMGELPGKTVEEWHRQLGPIIKLYLGVQTWIMIADPILAHKVFVTNSAKTSFRPKSHFTDLYSKGEKGVAFGQPSDVKWKSTRAKMQDAFVPKQIESYMDSIHWEAQELVHQLVEDTVKEEGVIPFEYFKWYAINTVFVLSFAKRFERVHDPEFKKFSYIIARTGKILEAVEDLPGFLPSASFLDFFNGRKSRGKHFFEDVRDPTFRRYIAEALNSDKPNIVKSIKEEGANWSEEEYIAFTADIISAGTDTIGVSLWWNLYLMCHYPACQKTAANEVDEFFRLNGRLPHFSERTQLPYIISVMKECMRFRPTMQFGLPHSTQEELEVDGYVFPKGCNIISSMHGMHLGSYFENANTFFPERYMGNSKTMDALKKGKIEERDQFNFGWGRRSCPGTYLAEVEMFLAFVQILATCTIEPPKEGMPDINEARNVGLNVVPPPCKLRFVKRHDSLV
ncbi:cytochrome P450 [Mucor mucedo]|uniref:cytochrome P450 n=1 Tax=Mucor mucedo TaxID=29922 RepID=UPI00222080DD|nr:cytochrome P450 [Mucor mucedo]KAI7891882.1 cytochrome P450 [Mucor mucedo]